jgi:hypothetical protein
LAGISVISALITPLQVVFLWDLVFLSAYTYSNGR